MCVCVFLSIVAGTVLLLINTFAFVGEYSVLNPGDNFLLNVCLSGPWHYQLCFNCLYSLNWSGNVAPPFIGSSCPLALCHLLGHLLGIGQVRTQVTFVFLCIWVGKKWGKERLAHTFIICLILDYCMYHLFSGHMSTDVS